MSNQAKRLSDCPSDRLAQCRGDVAPVFVSPEAYSLIRAREQAIQARCDALQQRLSVADQRACDLEVALGGMLFAFDDGVGRDWSAPLLDHARSLCKAVEFQSATAKKVGE